MSKTMTRVTTETLDLNNLPKNYKKIAIACAKCETPDGVISRWYSWDDNGAKEARKLALCDRCHQLFVILNSPRHSVFTVWAITMLLQPAMRGDLEV